MATFLITLLLLTYCARSTALKLQAHGTCCKNALGAIILFLSMSATFSARPEIQRCNSQDCKEITESIAASIDRTVRPCDDFYEHACGLWSKNHPAPHDTNNWNYPHIISNKVWYQLKDLLNAVNIKDADTLKSKAKTAYDVCKNMAEIENNGIEYLLAVTNDVGGWPMITPHKERTEATYSWQRVHVTYGGLIGKGALLTINVQEDSFRNNKPTLYLDQPTGLFKGLNIMNTEEDEEKYGEFVKVVAEAFGMERNKKIPDQKTLDKDIKQLLAFRKRLKKIMTWGPETRNVKRMYNLMTIKNLQDWDSVLNKKFNSIRINWKSFIEATIEFSRNIDITDEESVILHEKDYIKDLLIFLADVDEEVIVNHIHLFFVEKHLKYTDSKMRSLVSVVRNEHDKSDDDERWKTCILTHPMKHVLSLMFVKKYFSRTRRRELEELVANLQETAIEEIERSPWVSKDVKRNAVKKIEGIEFMYGYPDWYQNEMLMDDYYKGQDISDVYVYNVMSFERMEYRRGIETLSSLNFRDTAGCYPIDVDIGYIITRNELEIPAAALQLPYFSEDIPDVILYATTGQMLSHELFHAFDRQGRKYDERGIKNNWWDRRTLTNYNKRMNCIIDKYSNIPIKELEKAHPSLRANGMVTADEDFSDILGLKIAFKSYKKTRLGKKDGISINIPALKGLNENEIFFYANTQLYCEYIDEDTLIHLIENDDHSINRLRVNGPFSNMPEFSTIFSCPVDSFMNPRTKCYIWDN